MKYFENQYKFKIMNLDKYRYFEKLYSFNYQRLQIGQRRKFYDQNITNVSVIQFMVVCFTLPCGKIKV